MFNYRLGPKRLVAPAGLRRRPRRGGKLSKYTLMLAIAGCALPALAADYDFGGVDMKTCSHWDVIVADMHPTGVSAAGTEHLKDPQWRILAAQDMAAKGDGTYHLSAPCLFDGDTLVRCEGKLPFPMAGAAYRNTASGKQRPVYQCIEGCGTGVLQQLYDLTGEDMHPSRRNFADQIRMYEKHCAGRLDENGFVKDPQRARK